MFKVIDRAGSIVTLGYSLHEAITKFLDLQNTNPYAARLSWNSYVKCGYQCVVLDT